MCEHFWCLPLCDSPHKFGCMCMSLSFSPSLSLCMYIACRNHIKNFSQEKTFIINFPQYFSLVVNSEMIFCVCVHVCTQNVYIHFFPSHSVVCVCVCICVVCLCVRSLRTSLWLNILLRFSVWFVNFQCI